MSSLLNCQGFPHPNFSYRNFLTLHQNQSLFFGIVNICSSFWKTVKIVKCGIELYSNSVCVLADSYGSDAYLKE